MITAAWVVFLVSMAAGGVTVPPGGYAWAVVPDSSEPLQFETVAAAAHGPLAGVTDRLPETVQESILLCPEWIRADLATRFTDLLYGDVYSETPVMPGFFEFNGDGFSDVVLTSQSGSRVFSAPLWNEITEFDGSLAASVERLCDVNNDGLPDSSFISGDGVLSIFSGDSAILVTDGFSVSDPCGTALGDIDGDGIADLLVGTESGTVLVFRNRGSAEVPCFLPFTDQSRRAFPVNPGPFSSPVLFNSGDSLLVLAVGTRQNGLLFYSSPAASGSILRQWTLLNTVQNENPVRNISPAVVNVGGDNIVVCGSKSGVLYEAGIDSDSLEVLHVPPVPGSYPNLALAEVNGDKFPDLVAGTMEGTFYFLPGLDGWFAGNWQALEGLPQIPSGAPAPWENGLVSGSADGVLRYFVQNDSGVWEEVTAGSVFASVYAGGYSAPCFYDLNGDGTDELVTGNSNGEITLFEEKPGTGFQESFSWEFQPNGGVSSIESYYSRYFRPYTVFRSPSEESTAADFAFEIINAEPEYRDEIAWCIAETPTHILRAMGEHGDADLFTVNAESMYSMAENLRYVRLEDSAQGTQLSLNTAEGWIPVSRENYYRFVVHPRILFEIPGRIDASYWNTPRDTTSSGEREYLNYEPDSLFGHSPNHLFWREFIPDDNSRGEALRGIMSEAETYEEAVVRICNYQSHSQPGGLMTFGYMTNDLQPLTIYTKAYGSCGEQSILQTALSRACFVPAFVTGCRGEDHQWNQYLDPVTGRWNHWDINYGIEGIGNIWVSGEGVNHRGKTISTISAFGPGGRVWPVTCSTVAPAGSGYMEGDSGYTATAQVEVTVTDPAGTPVEGALVLLRSHWNNANSVSVFDYTGHSGVCVFNPGWEPNGGYTVDVVSPFGTAGSRNISFMEDSSYTVHYTVPYLVPAGQLINTPDSGSEAGVPVVETMYTVPYFTGSLYSIGSGSENLIHSSDWISWKETESEGRVLYMDGANFRSFRLGLNCNAVEAPFFPEPGDTCYAVLSNTNSMFAWKDFQVAELLPVERSAAPNWLGQPVPARNPVAGLSVSDNSSEPVETGTGWVEYHPDTAVFQDNPDDPLSSQLIIGPFTVPAGERSITIETGSSDSGLDIDLFLFMDSNGNRTVDGMEELLAKSTSPSAEETVFIAEPDTDAVYWIYLHGWNVDEGGGTVHTGLSFKPEPVQVYSLNPTGFQSSLPEQFSFAASESFEEGDVFISSGDQVMFPVKRDGLWYFEPDSPEEFFQLGTVDLLSLSGSVNESIKWEFAVDSVPPEVSIGSDGLDYLTMETEIEVTAEDSLSGIREVFLSVDSLERVNMAQRDGSQWKYTLYLLPFAGENISVNVCAIDFAGNETVKTWEISVVPAPEIVFSYAYPAGTVYDHEPVLQVFTGFDGTITASAELYGNGELHELAGAIVDRGLVQFPVSELLCDGDYTATISITGENGETLGEYSWGFTVGTMTSTR